MQVPHQLVGVPTLPDSAVPILIDLIAVAPTRDLALDSLVRTRVAQVMEHAILGPKDHRSAAGVVANMDMLDLLDIDHRNRSQWLPRPDHVLRRLPVRVHMHVDPFGKPGRGNSLERLQKLRLDDLVAIEKQDVAMAMLP